jgi:coenzyme F420-reducing hydrogenase delta subunit
LRRDINRLAKELDIEPIDLETQWASAMKKSQLENQIEDLNQQIAKGEKRK